MFLRYKTIFQVRDGAEYQAPEQLIGASDTKVFSTVYVCTIFDIEVMPKARRNDKYWASLDLLANKRDDSLFGEIFKAGGEVEYLALDGFRYPRMESSGTLT